MVANRKLIKLTLNSQLTQKTGTAYFPSIILKYVDYPTITATTYSMTQNENTSSLSKIFEDKIKKASQLIDDMPVKSIKDIISYDPVNVRLHKFSKII